MAQKSTKAAKKRKRGPGRPFKKGQSGNPGGRPKQLKELRVQCREFTQEVLDTLIAIVRDSGEKAGDRIKAGGMILAYGYGNPSQPIEFAKDEDGNAQPMEIVFNVAGKKTITYTAKTEGD